MTTAVRPVIDPQTREELQPPCELKMMSGKGCKNPAEWIVWFRCAGCGKDGGPKLWCGPDLDLMGSGETIYCPDCGISTLRIVWSEPLR